MITMEEAYRAGPDGVVDISPGSLFDQYRRQQSGELGLGGLNAEVGQSAGNPQLTLGQQYMAGNADVMNHAIATAQAEGLTGGDAYSNRLDEIALEHFNTFGRNEGRTGYGYSAPASGTFNPSPNDTPSFAPPLSSVGGGNQTMPPPANTMQPSNQMGYDFNGVNSQFQNALGNFGGLLDSFGSLTGGLLSGLQNNQTANAAYNPYQGYPNANYGVPNFQGYGGPNNMSSGWNAGSSWAGGNAGGSAGGAANTGHNMLWTV